MDKEKIARNAASTWCRCFKCEGIVNDTKTICDKDRLLTCHQWYNGYRTALLALDDAREEMIDKACKWLEKQGEQKPTKWSDEDEEMTDDLIKGCISAEKAHHFVHTPKEIANWLKSLKDRIGG